MIIDMRYVLREERTGEVMHGRTGLAHVTRRVKVLQVLKQTTWYIDDEPMHETEWHDVPTVEETNED